MHAPARRVLVALDARKPARSWTVIARALKPATAYRPSARGTLRYAAAFDALS
jgi:hypothetical protein